MSDNKTRSAVYVGTYHKYNCGSIAGKWLDLADYKDKGEFYEACKELHKDEVDPEFMFQDFEGIPEGMVSESHIDDEVWEWLELDDDDKDLLKVYRENINQEGTIDEARDHFSGKYNSVLDYAYEYIDGCYDLERMLGNLSHYFDYEKFAHDLEVSGDITAVEHDGDVYIFSN
jgi:antirestriction protein